MGNNNEKKNYQEINSSVNQEQDTTKLTEEQIKKMKQNLENKLTQYNYSDLIKEQNT